MNFNKCYAFGLSAVTENEEDTILWDMSIPCDKDIMTNKPNTVVKDMMKIKKTNQKQLILAPTNEFPGTIL